MTLSWLLSASETLPGLEAAARIELPIPVWAQANSLLKPFVDLSNTYNLHSAVIVYSDKKN